MIQQPNKPKTKPTSPINIAEPMKQSRQEPQLKEQQPQSIPSLKELLLCLNNNLFLFIQKIDFLDKKLEQHERNNFVRIGEVVVQSTTAPIKKLKFIASDLIKKHSNFLLMKKEQDIKLGVTSRYAE